MSTGKILFGVVFVAGLVVTASASFFVTLKLLPRYEYMPLFPYEERDQQVNRKDFAEIEDRYGVLRITDHSKSSYGFVRWELKGVGRGQAYTVLLDIPDNSGSTDNGMLVLTTLYHKKKKRTYCPFNPYTGAVAKSTRVSRFEQKLRFSCTSPPLDKKSLLRVELFAAIGENLKKYRKAATGTLSVRSVALKFRSDS